MATFEWTRAVNTTLKKFIRKEEIATLKKHRLPALLEDDGRYAFNWSGESTEQRIRHKHATLQGYDDMDISTFQRIDRWKIAELDWRGYRMTDAISEKEREMNKGEEALIKLFSNIGDILKEDAIEQFPMEYYKDGNAAGNEKIMHGLESFMGQGGSATVVAGFKSPTDTYAGLLTDLGNYGGSVSAGTWPESTNDPQYDFWSPILLDYTHATAHTDGATWAANCYQVISKAVTYAQRRANKDGQVNLVMMDMPMFFKLKDKMRAMQRMEINSRESQLVKLGFKDILNVDGCDATWEYGVTADRAYGIPTKKMETRSLFERLWRLKGPIYSEESDSYRFALSAYLNTWFSPGNFFKLQNYT